MIFPGKTYRSNISGYLVAAILCLPVMAYGQNKKWTLEECIRQALEENVALKQSTVNNEINKINYTQSRANQIPNLNLSDAQTQDFGRSLNPGTNQYSDQNISANALGVNSSVTLFNGLKNINLIKENRLNYEAGTLDIQKLSNDLMLNVVAAYMQVLFEYQAVEIARAQKEITAEHEGYTEKYVKAGSMPESTLLQIRAQLATDKATEVEAENELQLAKVTLMQYMEMPVNKDFDIEQPEKTDISMDIAATADDIYAKALDFLPEVKSASVKTTAAEIGLKIAKSEVLPKLVLGGSLTTSWSSANSLYSYQTTSKTSQIGYLASNPSEIVDGPVYSTSATSARYPFFRQLGDNFGEGLSLNLSVPIFNNLQFKSDIARSKVTIKAARLNENLVKNQLRKNIEIAYTDQLAASKNYMATGQQLVSEERSYRETSVKFKAGLITATDLFVEKNNFTKATLAHLQAKYQFMFKTKVVAFYSGNSITQQK